MSVSLAALLPACTTTPFYGAPNTNISIPKAINVALSWQAPANENVLAGMRLLRDGPPTHDTTLAVTRAILRTNPRIRTADAIDLASVAVRAADANGLDARFFCATLLQESAFDPRALSSAGAVGIAQFELSTAEGIGVDAFDPYSSIDGAARLLSSYVRTYGEERDPYALALAAYNAGPGAVAHYRGVPPYPETREYIGDIFERWSRIVVYELGTGPDGPRRIGRR